MIFQKMIFQKMISANMFFANIHFSKRTYKRTAHFFSSELMYLYDLSSRYSLCFEWSFPIMGACRAPINGLWSQFFVKALPIRPAYRPNFELGILSFELFSASPAIVSYPILIWKF